MCIVLSCRGSGRYFCRCYDRMNSMSEKIAVSPRHQTIRFLNGTVLEEHPWMFGTAMMSLDRPLYYEACNEHGLCMAAVSFEGYAVYSEDIPEGNVGVACFEMVPWVLAQCRDIQEVKDLLSKTSVLGNRFSNKIGSPPLHWMISDSTGSIVAEPLQDGLKITENPAEVMTHGPPIDFHLENLDNYIGLTCRCPRNLLPDRIRKEISCKGMGAVGLPGDYSSVSRFVRGCFVMYNTVPEEDPEEDVERMFRILEQVSVPKGCVEVVAGIYEYTRHEVCIDAERKHLYYRCYGNSQVGRIDVSRIDKDGNTPICFELIRVPQFLYRN